MKTVDYIFIYKGPEVDLNLNDNEVKSIRYVTKEELQELFAQAGMFLQCVHLSRYIPLNNAKDRGETVLTPWFKLIVDKFLYSWWDKLDSLDDMQDAKVIHRL